ncbi:hypothetical protein BKG96_03300 [Rodentibacter caecimuris]|uniref:Ash-like/host cell division inhibitor Icd-like protein n=1 Tax=Rodentibacter caecimuris TaxID=1796644 RepID=A0A1V3KN61_9PAST|nr:ash family protein [Rodentibacter heylii]OOF79102.1 hypothetical protein BKG96_03300 [Rodentibacter heylii]
MIFQKSIKNCFTKCGQIHYDFPASKKKLKVEPRNSNNKTLANSSTPNRAFFVRSTRTPKENNERKNALVKFLSMVACSGKGIALCCVPKFAVFEPVTRYRPKPRNFQAVAFNKLTLELSAMIYKFMFTGSRLRVAVYANSLNEALARLPKAHHRPALISRVKGGGLLCLVKPQPHTP